MRWLADESVQARYWAKVYRTPSTEDCWFFLGGISSTGHASFRAASRPGRTRTGTVPGHLYGYQLAHGVIPRLGWGTDSPTVCHTCDNHSCQQPTHLRLGTAAENRAEWLARRRDPSSPLADVRGPAGRSRAIGAAIEAGRKGGESAESIKARVRAAIAAGRPLSLW
ncbi:HNH endonuclease [Streptomyces sp. MUM 2J]|uniref:HNH endonuclease n=1 Tax=Streptomyces sp. MUM 2J TaxID=2791987 RepID=UPI001F0483A5|nr:HNH endonuclease [Streptomyces sp. MUM 2J]